MSQRVVGQLSLADAFVQRRTGLTERLEGFSSLLDWQAVDQVLRPLRPAERGAPGYPPLVLFRALLLAQWYGLSDERLEDELADRSSFRRFVGLSLADATPDHSTLWRFREALGREGLAEVAFGEVGRQFEERGLVLKKGTLIDATLVAAQAAKPKVPKAEASAAVPEGERPASKLVASTVDPDAGWTRRGGARLFGYKAHIGVDQASGLIRGQILTPAQVNETRVADQLIQGDEAAVYADKAYDSKARRKLLKKLKIKNRIQRRANKHHRLSARQEHRNKLIGHVRGRVETVFGFFKRVWHYRHVRYFNLRRNAAQLALMCMAYNLSRALRLIR